MQTRWRGRLQLGQSYELDAIAAVILGGTSFVGGVINISSIASEKGLPAAPITGDRIKVADGFR